MSAQTPKQFALSLAPGETLEQYAFAFVDALGAGWDPVGWTWRLVLRAATSPAATTPAALDLSDGAGTLVVDRANYRLTLAVSADATATLAAGTRYAAALAGRGPSGQAHYFFRGTVTTTDPVVPLTGDAVPDADVQETFTVTVTIPLSDVLVAGDFTALDAGVVDAADLPSSGAFARASDGYAVMDGASVVVLAGAEDGDHVALVGRLADAHDRGLYLGVERANYVANARDASGLGGAGTVTPPAQNTVLGPDGVAVSRIVTTDVQLGRTAGFIGVATGVPYTGSAWLAKLSGTGTTQLALGFATNTATSATTSTTWQRLDVTHTDATAQASLYLSTGTGAFSAVGGLAAGARDDEATLFQLEAGSFPTQPILATNTSTASTTTAQATRLGAAWALDASAAVDPSGRLSLDVACYPEGARGECDATPRLASGAADYVALDPDTGIVTVSIGGATNATTRPLTWERGDKLRLWISAGNNAATQVYYQLNDGFCGDLAATGSALGDWTATGELTLLSGGANYGLSAFLTTYACYRTGAAPSWVADPQWLPDFRASGTGFRNTTGVTAAQTAGFVATASLARVPVRVDGSQVDVAMYSTLVGFPNQAEITIEVPGAGFTTAQATAFNDRCVVRASVPGAGTRVAYFTNGMSARNATTPTVPLATWLLDVTAVDGTTCEVVPRASSLTELTVVLGDSIAVGQGGTDTAPAAQGFVALLRTTYDREVALEAYGSRALYHDKDNLDALVARLALLAGECSVAAGVCVYIELGTNDFGLGLWTGGVAAFQAAYQSLLTKIRAALPLARVVAPTIMTRTDATTNALGQTLAQFRTAQQAAYAAAALANASQPDGTALLLAAELSDGIHPTTAGHAALAGRIDAVLP